MPEAPPICSSVSRAAHEPLYGTASRVRGWVLLEQPGPWGGNALVQSRLDVDLGRELHARAEAARVRLLLVRRPGRDVPAPRRCFLAHTGRAVRWIEERWLDDPADLLGLDLAGVREGERPGFGDLLGHPLHLVCTNGRHDRCCASHGRPLAAALEAADLGERVWECSHIGGDRFAGNLVCFPHGVYYGRVRPDDGPRVAGDYERGLLDLGHFRGRSHDPPVVQAAEWLARRRLGLRHLDDLAAEHAEAGPPGTVRVRFAGPHGPVEVGVQVGLEDEPRPLTCHSTHLEAPPTYRLVELDREPAA